GSESVTSSSKVGVLSVAWATISRNAAGRRRGVRAPNRRRAGAGGSDAKLRRDDLDVGEPSVPLEGHLHGSSDEVAHEGPLEVADAGNRPAVEGHDQVPGPDPGARRRARV